MRGRDLAIGALLLLPSACTGDPTGPLRPAPEDIFDELWESYDREYALFPWSNVDWVALRPAYRDSAAATTTNAELARVLGSLVRQLNDGHADLVTPHGLFGPDLRDLPRNYDPEAVLRYLRSPLQPTTSGRILHALLSDSVGYIRVPSMEGSGWGGEIDAVLLALGEVRAFVVDIRGNMGGNESNGREIASRFYDTRRVYRLARYRSGPGHHDLGAPRSWDLGPSGSKQFAQPTIVLTNRYVASAGEDFLLMLKALPQVTVVGDTTYGLGSNPLTLELSNGWLYRVPRSVQMTPDGWVYQWRGLAPDVAVPWTAVDGPDRRDPYIEAALELLSRALSKV